MSHEFEEEDLGRVYDPHLLRRLLGYARPHALTLGLCVVLLLAVSALELAQPYIVKVAIDQEIAGPGGTPGGLPGLAALYLACLAASGCIGYVNSLLIQGTGQRIVQTIRQDLFAHLQRLSLAFFDRNPVGRLVTRVANDTETLNEMYTSVLVNLFRDVFVIAGTLAVMLHLDWRLALIGMGMLPVIAVAAFVFQRLIRAAWRVVRVRLARVNATLAENFSGMRIIHAFGRQQRQLREFREVNDALYEASWAQLRLAMVFRPLIELLSQLALAGLLWYGGLLALDGAVALGTLYAFTSYLRQLYNPIGELAEKFNILQAAMASGERLVQLLDTPPDVEDPPSAAGSLPPGAIAGSAGGRIDLRGVHFSYRRPGNGTGPAMPGDPMSRDAAEGAEAAPSWVLRDVTLAVAPGQTVAFVGHTGAGKSTILNLIARFYDVQEGQVLLDGADVRALRQADVRRALGIVLQEPFLFTGTIADNIRLDLPLDDEQVAAKLREAGGAHLLAALPDGVRTAVSERGSSLSTGERQIVCFARALARDPAILVLDEATASVDSHTEQSIQEALLGRSGRRTTLIVAHRLATVQHADQIVVLHKGRVREVGTHLDLLARAGLYHKLWMLQSVTEPAAHETPASY
ncbi:MAG: ABC transporter ATP-binding protein [Candidatus Sericytochromatia bacterium]|nr:ABC transporter ATP-binding protein [Candidatus Tanganyikabacteria bacterium]